MKKLREIFSGKSKRRSEPSTITEPFTMIAGRTVAEICGDFKLQEEAKAHLSGQPAPHGFVDKLIRAGLYADATRFLAYALPKRQAVWWVSLCVRTVSGCCSDPTSTAAVQAADTWVKNPTEPAREAALAAGGKHNFEMPGAPAGWTAMAAGWSGGTAKTDDENIPASPKHLTAHAAAGAIMLAAMVEPDRATETYRRFLETGVQIAQGKMQIMP